MAYVSKLPFPCTICGKPSLARRLCRSCYYRMRRHGELANFTKIGPQDVFLQRIDKSGICWTWTGMKNDYGYGLFEMPGGKRVRAHRMAYELFRGPIPDDLVVMHLCDNPICVNPWHLEPATRTENNRDAVAKRRNTFGEKNGHAKLTSQQIDAIKSDTRPYATIARTYGVSRGHIGRIKTGERRSKG